LTKTRNFTFSQAIQRALYDAMKADSRVIVMGLGVADVKGVFGTTSGLQDRFGRDRVFDIPLSENAMTGAALGMAMMGIRPVFVHQRADFAFTAAEQIVNQIAKTIFTTRGDYSVPIVIRMIIGRGWGQGPTHAQAPHGFFASVPGLRVVAPSGPRDAYCMLRNAIEDSNPVIFIEHRWLHDLSESDAGLDSILNAPYKAAILRSGEDLTLIGVSYGFVEAARLAGLLGEFGLDVELVDLRSISPLDTENLIRSINKTRRLAIVDIAAPNFSVGAELTRVTVELAWGRLLNFPLHLAPRFAPVPSSPKLALGHYPRLEDMAVQVNRHFGFNLNEESLKTRCMEMNPPRTPLRDQPDLGQVGPF
jgi:pyruvate dehydrogenase E1 component beta subunit